MENKILKTLNIGNISQPKPILKPLVPLKDINTNQNVTLNSKDKLFVSSANQSSKLVSPLQLFNNQSLNGLNIFKNDISIIEPGTSINNQNAVKQFPGKTWLGKLDSNNNREVAIIIPKGVDYSKPFEIIYHFHGHNGKLDNILTGSANGLEAKIKNMPKDKNVIIVIPQGPPKTKDYTWMNGKYNEALDTFQDQTISIIKNKLSPGIKINTVSVEGHSAGGRVILNAAKDGNLRADKIDMLDSSYGTWASEAYKNYHQVNPNAKFNVVYIPNSPTQADALRLKGQPGVTMHQSKVDHSSVPKTFLGI